MQLHVVDSLCSSIIIRQFTQNVLFFCLSWRTRSQFNGQHQLAHSDTFLAYKVDFSRSIHHISSFFFSLFFALRLDHIGSFVLSISSYSTKAIENRAIRFLSVLLQFMFTQSFSEQTFLQTDFARYQIHQNHIALFLDFCIFAFLSPITRIVQAIRVSFHSWFWTSTSIIMFSNLILIVHWVIVMFLFFGSFSHDSCVCSIFGLAIRTFAKLSISTMINSLLFFFWFTSMYFFSSS